MDRPDPGSERAASSTCGHIGWERGGWESGDGSAGDGSAGRRTGGGQARFGCGGFFECRRGLERLLGSCVASHAGGTCGLGWRLGELGCRMGNQWRVRREGQR